MLKVRSLLKAQAVREQAQGRLQMVDSQQKYQRHMYRSTLAHSVDQPQRQRPPGHALSSKR